MKERRANPRLYRGTASTRTHPPGNTLPSVFPGTTQEKTRNPPELENMKKRNHYEFDLLYIIPKTLVKELGFRQGSGRGSTVDDLFQISGRKNGGNRQNFVGTRLWATSLGRRSCWSSSAKIYMG